MLKLKIQVCWVYDLPNDASFCCQKSSVLHKAKNMLSSQVPGLDHRCTCI